MTKHKPINNKLILELLSAFSMLLMLYPILFKNVSYPSNWSVIACIGGVLYIYAGCNEKYNTLVNKFLSIKPIVFIGLISYSLYLWHWPIIAYLNYIHIEKTYFVKIVVFFISVLLAALTYFIIEKPFRHKIKMSFSKTLILLWIIPIICACCFALGSKYINNFGFNKYYEKNIVNVSYKCFTDANSSGDYINKKLAKNLPPEQQCIIGNIKKSPTFLLVGDSHAQSSIGMLDVFLNNINASARIITQAGTPFVLGKYITNELSNKNMKSRNVAIAKLIEKEHYKYIVLAGFWNLYNTNDYWRIDGVSYHDSYFVLKNGLEEAIKFIIKEGAIPIIIEDAASTLNLKINCGMYITSAYVDCHNPYNVIKKNQSEVNDFINKMHEKYPQIIIIEPNKIICENSYCKTSIDHVALYKTAGFNSHLSLPGSKFIGELYLGKYGNPLREIIKNPFHLS